MLMKFEMDVFNVLVQTTKITIQVIHTANLVKTVFKMYVLCVYVANRLASSTIFVKRFTVQDMIKGLETLDDRGYRAAGSTGERFPSLSDRLALADDAQGSACMNTVSSMFGYGQS